MQRAHALRQVNRIEATMDSRLRGNDSGVPGPDSRLRGNDDVRNTSAAQRPTRYRNQA
jgi:hypothetical protein